MYKSYICPLSDASVSCQRQFTHSQTHVFSFPPWTLYQIQMIKPADKFYPARGLRKQESLAVHHSLATPAATRHIAQAKGNVYPSAWPNMEEDTLPKHDPCQIWAKIKFPPPRTSEKQTNPASAADFCPGCRNHTCSSPKALCHRRATACWEPRQFSTRRPAWSTSKELRFWGGKHVVFLFLLEVRKYYYLDQSGAMTHTNLCPSWVAKASPPHPHTSHTRQSASGAWWSVHQGKASVRFVSNKQPFWKTYFLAFPTRKCQLGFLMGYLTCLNKCKFTGCYFFPVIGSGKSHTRLLWLCLINVA